MSMRKTIDPADWLNDWQIAQREYRRLIRRLRRLRRLAIPLVQ